MRTPYQDIEIKKISEKYVFDWTPFGMLLAYYENERFNMKIDIGYLVKCLSKLKDLIDNGKVFFDYHNKDFSRRFFVLENKVKELPVQINLTNETALKFGAAAERISKNWPPIFAP